jgi:group I intron endonuclease
MGYIYKITNKIDQKVYVGQTSRDLELRWREHKKKRSNCKYLKHAFEKHGIENFKFDLICVSFDENLNSLEEEYIKKFNSLVPNGYNLRNGGNNGKLNEETKKKISETLKVSLKNKVNVKRIGKSPSEETRKKLSEKLKGIKKSEETRQSFSIGKMKGRVIAQYDLNGNKLTTFSGYKEIYEKHNYNKPPIFCCCKGERKSAYG